MRERKVKKLFQGRWLSIKRATYRTPGGGVVEWEVVERTRQETVILLLARLLPSGRVILLRQFRAGINQPVIALPAGVVPPEGDLAEYAARELAEETGYRGRVAAVSVPLKINPAILDCDAFVFEMEVDESDPANLSPRQELEPEEEIEVLLVPEKEVNVFLRKARDSGTAVDVSCWLAFRGVSRET